MISSEDGLNAYMKQIAQFPVLTHAEEKDHFQRLADGDASVSESIVKRNLRLVVKIALRYRGRGVPLPDLIQEGNIGLVEVVGRFDLRKGYRFSTYATFWIEQAIQQIVFRQARLVRLPVRKSRMLGRINEATNVFRNRVGREPHPEEIADAANATPEQVEQLARHDLPPISFDAPGGEDGGRLRDNLVRNDAPDPREQAMNRELRLRVREVLERLTDRERQILYLRFGLSGEKALSLQATGEQVGLSPEGVRRVEKKTLEKLRTGSLGKQISGLL